MNKSENDKPVELDEARLDEVSGGPIYMQPVGLGQISQNQPSSPIAHVGLADGSVKGVG